MQDPILSLKISVWCRCLSFCGQNETYIFCAPPRFKKRSRATAPKSINLPEIALQYFIKFEVLLYKTGAYATTANLF